jgi:nucleoside-diphosphate-sugar epimerase
LCIFCSDYWYQPETGIGKAKYEAEKALGEISGLPLVIVRPASYVYGASDVKGLAPRFCIAAVYRKLGEKLEYPQWFEDLKIPTVHVLDVVKALWHVAINANAGSIFNVVDKNETDQKKLNALLEKLFGIKTGHLNLLKSEGMKLLSMESILSDINGENIKVWLDLVNGAKLEFSPLSPYLDAEVLQTNSYVVNGNAIEATGYSYSYPTVQEEALRDQINYAVKEGWFPPNYLQ